MTTDTITVTVRDTASGTGSIGGSAIRLLGEYAAGDCYWLGYIQQLNFADNSGIGGNRGILIDADQASTTDNTIYDMVISHNQLHGNRINIELQTCKMERLSIVSNVLTGALLQALRVGTTDSDWNNGAFENNYVMTDQYRSGDEALFLSAIRNISIGGNKIISASYGMRLYANTNSVTVAGVHISGNRIDVSGSYGRDAIAIQDGTVTLGRNETRVASNYRGVSIPSGSPTISYGEQERGSSALTPTVAGGLGDSFIQSTPGGGADLKWICTAAGGSGAATWTKVY